MKKVVFILIFLIILTVNAEEKIKIRVGAEDKEDYPSITGSEVVSQEKPGVGVEMVRILEKKLGVEAQISRFPWKRVLNNLETGKSDIIFTASYKPERENLGVYPKKDGKIDNGRAFSLMSYSVYRLKGTKVGYDGKNFTDLTGGVGAPAGYSIIDELKSRGVKVDESPSSENDFKKLIAGRVQLVVAIESTANSLMRRNKEFDEKIEKVGVLKENHYFFMISHQFYDKYPELSEKIFDKIAEIRDSDEFKKIEAEY